MKKIKIKANNAVFAAVLKNEAGVYGYAVNRQCIAHASKKIA